jgi:hypothetical protein
MLASRIIKRRALRALCEMPPSTLAAAHLAQLKGAFALLIHLDEAGKVDNAKVIRQLPQMIAWAPHVVVWLREPSKIERAIAISRLKAQGGVAFKLNLPALVARAERNARKEVR